LQQRYNTTAFCEFSALIGKTGAQIAFSTRMVIATISVLAYIPVVIRLTKVEKGIEVGKLRCVGMSCPIYTVKV
jgi:hypothetical protein